MENCCDSHVPVPIYNPLASGQQVPHSQLVNGLYVQIGLQQPKYIQIHVPAEKFSEIGSNTYRTLPDQVPHPPLAISASIIKPEMNCPDPCIHNLPARLEESRRWWPPIDRYKQGSDNCEKNCCSDMT